MPTAPAHPQCRPPSPLAGSPPRFDLIEYYERVDGQGFVEIRRLPRVEAAGAAALVDIARLGRAGFGPIVADPAGQWAFAERPCINFGAPPTWLQVIEAESV